MHRLVYSILDAFFIHMYTGSNCDNFVGVGRFLHV